MKKIFQTYTKLTLNNITYTKANLQKIATEKLANSLIQDWEKNLYQFILDWLNDTNTITVKTSGSTGTPKLIQLEKQKMVASALATGQYFGFEKNQVVLLCLPCAYIAGKMMVVRSFVWGLNLITVNPSSNPLENIHTPITFSAMIPLQVIQSLTYHKNKLNQIEQLIIGGGVVDSTLQAQLQTINTACFATYGMTETITHIAIKPLNGKNKSDVYQALKGVNFSTDTRNCLVIDAPYVANEKIITNDIIALKSSTSFEWLGRWDNIINTGGIKVNPEQVENRLSTIISNRFFIAAQTDEKLGERIVLLIEGNKWKQEKIKALKEQMKLQLNKFQIPKTIYFLSKFVETPTGKIQRTKNLLQLSML